MSFGPLTPRRLGVVRVSAAPLADCRAGWQMQAADCVLQEVTVPLLA